MSRVTIYDCPLCGARVEGQENYTLHLLQENPNGVTTGQFLRWGAGSRAVGARIFDLREKGHEIDTRPISGSSTFLYVLTGFNDAEGSSRGHVLSSHRSAPAAPLNAAGPSRWFCYVTNACLRAGPLDGPACPRGAHHETHTEQYVNLAPHLDAVEEMAA